MTESIYNNSLADHHIWSTIKTLPATLPEPWAVVRGQCLAVKASRLPPRGRRTGVTGADCEIWIDLGQGVGAYVRVVDYSGLGRVMEGWRQSGPKSLRDTVDTAPLGANVGVMDEAAFKF